MNGICLNVQSQATKNRVFSQRIDFAKRFRCEILYIADYEYVSISSFAVLDTKLWLKEDANLHTDHPFHSFKFVQSEA